jgi:hypothetical protein
MPQPGARCVTIIIPTCDDWDALGALLPALDAAWPPAREARLVLVDDGSLTSAPIGFFDGAYPNLARIDVLRLKRNLGHQRAIAVGLCHVCARPEAGPIVVMDGDGEDDPRDLAPLLDRLGASPAPVCVFAERKRRAEGWAFRLGYLAFRVLHRLLTGIPVRFGNYSALDRALARRLTTAPDLWNHYAATVVKSSLPIALIPTRRQPRLAGRSRMRLGALVAHGLSAISVFSDRVGTRLLIASGALMSFVAALVAIAIAVRVFTPLAIPGWATSAVGLLAVLLLQLFALSLMFAFMVLAGRQGASFLPERDHVHFIEGVQTVWPTPTNTQAPSSISSPAHSAGSAT